VPDDNRVLRDRDGAGSTGRYRKAVIECSCGSGTSDAYWNQSVSGSKRIRDVSLL
jgi:hypothetical protein